MRHPATASAPGETTALHGPTAAAQVALARLLAAATAEVLEQPDLGVEEAVDLAEQRHQDANAARAARLTRCDDSDDDEGAGSGSEEPGVAVSAEVVNAALTAFRSLLAGVRGGAQQLTGYEAGSLRLCVDELATLLRTNGDMAVTHLPYH